MRKIALTLVALTQVALILIHTHADKKRPLHTTLFSSERVLSDDFSPKDIAQRFSGNEQILYTLGIDRKVCVFDSQYRPLLAIHTRMESPDSISVDSVGKIYVGDSNANQIRVFSSKGDVIRTIPALHPLTIAVLSNGNLVVGSGFNGSLLQMYDSVGNELRRFGQIKRFVANSVFENNFLNRGKVLVDSSDTIYYVYRYAPIPTVQRFSTKGKLLSEFAVEGAAVDLQLELAQNFLKGRNERIGGIGTINSAAIDPVTNDIWVCMNGSSESGVAYRYTSEGTKVQEYRFIVSTGSASSKVITAPYHIVARTPSVCIFTSSGAFSFDLNGGRTSAEFQPLDAACGAGVEFSGCKTTCGTETTSDDQDCKAALLETVNLNNHHIVEAHCNVDSTSCSASIKLCRESNGVISDHSISLSCSSGGGGGFAACEPCLGNGDCQQCDPYGYCDGTSSFCYSYSPILVDINGDGYQMTDAAGGVAFDLNGNGHRESLSWTAAGSDDSWLALDRNGNGIIDNGTELFGNFTPQPPAQQPNGFLALAEYDKPGNGGNGDGVIDHSDAVFSSLRLWQDVNHDGISQPGEMHLLPRLGVSAISLDYGESRRVDQYGNRFRYRAKVFDSTGAHVGRWAWDVFLVPQR